MPNVNSANSAAPLPFACAKGSIRLLLAAGFLGLCLSSGCAHYFEDRAYDFVDVFGLKVVAGRGVRFGVSLNDVKLADPLGGFYLGFYDHQKFGFQGRSWGVWNEKGTELAFFTLEHDLTAVRGNDFLFKQVAEHKWLVEEGQREGDEDYRRYKHNRPVLNFIGDFQLLTPQFFNLFPGFELNLNAFQAMDFIFGIVAIDICLDDWANRQTLEEFQSDFERDFQEFHRAESRDFMPEYVPGAKGTAPVKPEP